MSKRFFAGFSPRRLAAFFVGALLVSGLGMVGCDDDDDGNNVVRVQMNTITSIVNSSTSLTTLEQALAATNLDSVLDGDGPFTVLAPTDQAFDEIPDSTLDSLLADPDAELREILLYHVIQGDLPEDSLIQLGTVTTFQGEDVTISVRNGEVFVNDSAAVITSDIDATNGTVHLIDQVLIPPSIQL
ncbi:MAG: fasciclin domain-containing protein [Chitinivibrionales bacterium]|nr:fasciclin domain-containing protein [Chitinivibrionales bacterium]